MKSRTGVDRGSTTDDVLLELFVRWLGWSLNTASTVVSHLHGESGSSKVTRSVWSLVFVRQEVGRWSLMRTSWCVASNLPAIKFASQDRQGLFWKTSFNFQPVRHCSGQLPQVGRDESCALAGCASCVVPGKRRWGAALLKCDLSRE